MNDDVMTKMRKTVRFMLAILLAWLAISPRAGAQETDLLAAKQAELSTAVSEASKTKLALEQAVKPLKDALDKAEKDLAAKPQDTALVATRDQMKAAYDAKTPGIIALEKELDDKNARVAEKQKQVDAAKAAADTRLRSDNTAIYKGSLAILTMLFVLAVVLENALEVIFRWRLFQAYFSLRGVKVPIMIAAGIAMVWLFKIDIVANLITLYKSPDLVVPPVPDSNFMSKLITAFTLAGGSAGVNQLMISLGLRAKAAPEQTQPPAGKAWVAIRLTRNKVVGDPLVHFEEVQDQAAAATPVMGCIRGEPIAARDLIFRNRNRFPENGGRAVDPDKVYRIFVRGKDKEGNDLDEVKLGPYRFGQGAIVDFDVKL